MRTIINIPDIQVKVLDQLSKKKKISRAEIIRQALDNYVSNYNKNERSYKAAFGIWQGKEDRISCQQALRDEWS